MGDAAEHPVYRLDKRARDLLAGWRGRRGRSVAERWELSFVGLVGRLMPLLQAVPTEHAFGGPLALQLYGGKPWDREVSLHVSAAAWAVILQSRAEGLRLYDDSAERGGISFEGIGFRASVSVSAEVIASAETRYGLRLVSLAHLIVPRLQSPQRERLDEVCSLIQANDLTEGFLTQLPDELHAAYLACL
jgi:hypothetical protein